MALDKIKKYSSKELLKWFREKIKQLFAGNTDLTNPDHLRRRILASKNARGAPVVGKMYFFAYDPKLKEILPIYDKFPLVLPIEYYSDGFLGLNLHYLGSQERYAVLMKLLDFRNNTKMDNTTKIQMSYRLLKSVSKLQIAEVCIKRYLYNHVRSPFIEILPDEWDKSIQLPVEDFVRK